MPGPCSAFQSVNNFGNRFYPKEKRLGCALLFWIESVTKVVNRLKRTRWTRHQPKQANVLEENHASSADDSLQPSIIPLHCTAQGTGRRSVQFLPQRLAVRHLHSIKPDCWFNLFRWENRWLSDMRTKNIKEVGAFLRFWD